MKESRSIDIKGKRLTGSDVLALAAIFQEQADLARRGGRRHSLSFGLRCRDGTSYDSEAADVFKDEECVGLRPPQAVEMTFHDYELNRYIRLTAVRGGAYGDSLSISGEEPKWVREVLLRAKERIDSLESTDNWFTKHRRLTAFIGMLGFGSLMQLALVMVVAGLLRTVLADWDPDPATVQKLRQSVLGYLLLTSPASYLVDWICRYLMGGAPWLYFEGWFYEAFPSTELAFGPQHLRTEVQRRKRIRVFITVVAIPLLLAFVYDVVKAALAR